MSALKELQKIRHKKTNAATILLQNIRTACIPVMSKNTNNCPIFNLHNSFKKSINQEIHYFLQFKPFNALLEPLAPYSQPPEIGTFIVGDNLALTTYAALPTVHTPVYIILDENTDEYLIRYTPRIYIWGTNTGTQSLHHLKEKHYAFYK